MHGSMNVKKKLEKFVSVVNSPFLHKYLHIMNYNNYTKVFHYRHSAVNIRVAAIIHISVFPYYSSLMAVKFPKMTEYQTPTNALIVYQILV